MQAQPAQAPQPWLPLQSLQLRYTSAPTQARTGEAANVVVEAVAEGATRAQFTDLPVPDVGNAAQVFAEPAQYEETFNGSTPRLKITRRYSIVPRQPGSLVVPGPRLPWWDVRAGRHRKRRCRTDAGRCGRQWRWQRFTHRCRRSTPMPRCPVAMDRTRVSRQPIHVPVA